MPNMKELLKLKTEDEKVVDVQFRDRNGDLYRGLDGEPATIGFVGSESAAYRKLVDEVNREGVTDRQAMEVRIHLASHASRRWSGWHDGKKDLPYSVENVAELLGLVHLLPQAEGGINRRARFFANGDGSSPES